jgi:hypothetical protein
LAQCDFHPDRPGVGICMRCRTPICAACCTRVFGINHCHACLKALAQRRDPERRRAAEAAKAVLLLGLVFLLFTGAFWLIEGRFAP